MYDDEYPSCEKTYATLRLYPGDTDPSSVTERLGIEPTEWQSRNQPLQRAGRSLKTPEINGWFLSSRGHVESGDSRRHIDWLLDRMAPKVEAILGLQEAGCRMNISCYWLSRSGNGGPTVSPPQMKRLAELGIELWFDFYSPYCEEPPA
jgi:hypothetical protein